MGLSPLSVIFFHSSCTAGSGLSNPASMAIYISLRTSSGIVLYFSAIFSYIVFSLIHFPPIYKWNYILFYKINLAYFCWHEKRLYNLKLDKKYKKKSCLLFPYSSKITCHANAIYYLEYRYNRKGAAL